ncbi:MAG: hypothetical protein WCR67_01305 [Bacilli bacterium]
MQSAYNKGTSVKIKSIICLNEDDSSTWAKAGIVYSSSLTDFIIEKNENSQVVTYQKENSEYDVLTGKIFEEENTSSGRLEGLSQFLSTSKASYENNLVLLGASSTPSSITIYPKDFESKDKIIEVLNAWNTTEVYRLYGNDKDSSGNYLADSYQVNYTDISAMMVTMLGI